MVLSRCDSGSRARRARARYHIVVIAGCVRRIVLAHTRTTYVRRLMIICVYNEEEERHEISKCH